MVEWKRFNSHTSLGPSLYISHLNFNNHCPQNLTFLKCISVVYYNQSIHNPIILKGNYFRTKAINSTLCTICTQMLVEYVRLYSMFPTLPIMLIIYSTFIAM